MRHDSIEAPAAQEAIRTLSVFAESFLAEVKIAEERRQQFLMALDEVVTNIVSYAYPKGKRGSIHMSLDDDGAGHIAIALEDYGVEFNPLSHEDPKFNIPIEERKIGGMGIPMIKNFCDSLLYERDGGRNRLTLAVNYSGANCESQNRSR